MTSALQPKGPLPPRVYWRRRLIVLGILVVVVVVVILIVVAATHGGKGAGPTASQTPGGVSTDAPTDAATPGGACDPTKLELTADTDQSDYAAGVQPQLWFAVENKSAATCTLDVSASSVVYTITSPSGTGDETYWTSADCSANATPAPPQSVTLKPGVPVESSTKGSWNLTRSSQGDCVGTGQTPLSFDSQVSFKFTVTLGTLTASKQFYIE